MPASQVAATPRHAARQPQIIADAERDGSRAGGRPTRSCGAAAPTTPSRHRRLHRRRPRARGDEIIRPRQYDRLARDQAFGESLSVASHRERVARRDRELLQGLRASTPAVAASWCSWPSYRRAAGRRLVISVQPLSFFRAPAATAPALSKAQPARRLRPSQPDTAATTASLSVIFRAETPRSLRRIARHQHQAKAAAHRRCASIRRAGSGTQRAKTTSWSRRWANDS